MALKSTMNKLVCNGWDIFFHPQLFGVQYQELVDRVAFLKQRLSNDEFKTFASYFALTGPLKRYGRMKKMGLPDRYRLFFRVFDTPEMKAIVILWLGFPRKEGAKDDCYSVFTKMVMRGEFPSSLEAILEP
jgi:toxin YhaV